MKLKLFVGANVVIAITCMIGILVVGFIQIRKGTDIRAVSETPNNEAIQEAPDQSTLLDTLEIDETTALEGSPEITFSATPSTIGVGGTTTLTWVVANADVCGASNGWSGTKILTGSQSTEPLQTTTKYSLTCVNSVGPRTTSVLITVDPTIVVPPPVVETPPPQAATPSQPAPTGVAPQLTLSVSKATIKQGESASLSWSINGNASPAPTCQASGSWTGAKATSGSQTLTPTAGSYTYNLQCTSSAGTTSKSATVNVTAPVTCGTGGPCSLADIASHTTADNCWVLVSYSANGGNSTGQVFKIAASFFGVGGGHDTLKGSPSIDASAWCGKNISSAFNTKHSGGTRSDGTNNAIWWLTHNGNSLIGPYSGN